MIEAGIRRGRKRKTPVFMSSAWDGFRAIVNPATCSDDCIPVVATMPKLRCRNIARLFQPFSLRTSDDNTFDSFVQLEDSDSGTEIEDATESPRVRSTYSYKSAPIFHIPEVEAPSSEGDQKPENVWTCSRCTLHNSPNKSKCSVCGCARQDVAVMSVKKRRIIVDEDDDEDAHDKPRHIPEIVNTEVHGDEADDAVSVAEEIHSDGHADYTDEYDSYSEESGDEDSIYSAESARRSSHVIDLTEDPEPTEVMNVHDDIEDFEEATGFNGATFNDPALKKHFM